MSKNKKILLIFPGPIYKVEEVFKVRLEYLSRYYNGVLLTNGPSEPIQQIGEFEIIKYPDKDYMTFLDILLFYVYAIKLVKKHTREDQRFDLIVTYDPLKMGILGVLLAKFCGAKFIVEVNGDYADIKNYSDESNKIKRLIKRKLYATITKSVLKRANGIKLLFDRQIDFCRAVLKQPVIMRFPDFVDTSPFESSGEENVVLVAGFPFYRKGIDILIEAFKRVSNKYPDWTLKILGHYPDKILLDKYIADHPKIFHQKAVHYKDMPDQVRRCAIVVLPSRSEAMGRILIEAMAAGKARIGANVGGIHTVIEDGKDGFLFDSENVDALESLLDKLMGDAELRKKLGTASIKRADEEFGKKNYFEKLNKLYQDVLSQ